MRPRARRLLGILRDLLIAAVLLLVVSSAIGWLRAPDLPEVAPDFRLVDLDGNAVVLSDLRGRTVVLNFWATWCLPCRLEIPAFSRFARNHPDMVVLGLAVDGTVPELRAAKARLGIAYPVVRADEATVAAYGAHTLPTTVVVGPDGAVRSAHVGLMTPPQLAWATR